MLISLTNRINKLKNLSIANGASIKLMVFGFIFLLLFSILILAYRDGNPQAFIYIGLGNQIATNGEMEAYDGLISYKIALDPLGAYKHINPPAYRYQRILYPFFTWLFSFGGHPALVPWVMLLINLAAISIAGGLMGEILERYGLQAWHAATLFISAGVLISLRADLNEPLAILFGLIGLLLFYQHRCLWAAISFALAILAKEIAATFVVGVVAWVIYQREFRKGLTMLLVSLLPSILWGLVLTFWMGQSPLSARQAAIEIIPFNGLRFIGLSPAKELTILWVAIPALLFGLVGIVDLFKRRISVELFILLANVGLIACMPTVTWINVSGALRVVISLTIASLIYTARGRSRIVPWVGAYWMVPGLILIPVLITGPH